MKRVIISLMIVFSLIFIGTQRVNADGYLTLTLKPSKQTVAPGETFSIELRLKSSPHLFMNESSLLDINFDSSKVEYVNYTLNKSVKSSAVNIGANANTWLKSRSTVTIWFKEDLPIDAFDSEVTIVTLNFKVKNGVEDGVVVFNLAGRDSYATDLDGTYINIGTAGSGVSPEESSDNDLVALGVTNTNIVFNGNTSYSAKVANDVSSVEIFAVASSINAEIDGIGVKDLKVGKNEFDVVVIAEDGSEQTYNIVIDRAEALPVEESKGSSDSILAIIFGGITVVLAGAVVVLYLKMKKASANTV